MLKLYGSEETAERTFLKVNVVQTTFEASILPGSCWGKKGVLTIYCKDAVLYSEKGLNNENEDGISVLSINKMYMLCCVYYDRASDAADEKAFIDHAKIHADMKFLYVVPFHVYDNQKNS
ncbi:PREDICTED: uncharacterized protein LOC104816745 [Tarenaya hassleriana]|uniref:uncharacterized protein LOC104816745 n=1 Tax=Tarenaya hassleriana TaxID=28532 RepID=UPI00053C9D88|nr:PREDICTED: uncharacterized protein LOC104816745 [Tarenaya hassleriana]